MNRDAKEHSFIADARRQQITQATIDTLNEIGYVNTSLAQIARRAGISTALISYHFEDKHELIDYTLVTLFNNISAFVTERMKQEESPLQKLHAYIRANLAYQRTHPEHYHALLEIVFNARTADNVPYYKLTAADDEEEAMVVELQRLLAEGQARGDFRPFNVQVMANAIQGALEYTAVPSLAAQFDTAAYGDELVEIFDRAVLLY